VTYGRETGEEDDDALGLGTLATPPGPAAAHSPLPADLPEPAAQSQQQPAHTLQVKPQAAPRGRAASKRNRAAAPGSRSRGTNPFAARGVDWKLARQQYRTGQYSDAALAHIHGCTPQRVQQVRKKEGWVKDLAEEVQAIIEDNLDRDHAATAAPAPEIRQAEAITDQVQAEAARQANSAPPGRTEPGSNGQAKTGGEGRGGPEVSPSVAADAARTAVNDQAAVVIGEGDEHVIAAAVNRAMGIVEVHRRDSRALGRLASRLLQELELTTATLDELRETALALRHADRSGATRARLAQLERSLTLSERTAAMRNLAGAFERLVRVERVAMGIERPGAGGSGGSRPQDGMPLESRMRAYRQQAGRASLSVVRPSGDSSAASDDLGTDADGIDAA
jgi:hypothetical protein